MSKKKDRAWFDSPKLRELVAQHYANDQIAASALATDPRVLARLRERTPMAKATLLKLLRRFATQHAIGAVTDALIVDTRSR
jgi:hypothetical protein